MTLNRVCIAGGESGAHATHLYLQLSMVFREPHIHTLIYTQVGAQMERRQRNAEKQSEEQEEMTERGRDAHSSASGSQTVP